MNGEQKSYILVVDDEKELRELLVSMLEARGVGEVVAAASGNEAVRILTARGAPRLVISDLKMPDGDGAFLGQHCRLHFPRVPFVLCTGNEETEARARVPHLHAYIQKPRIFDPLVSILSSLGAEEAESAEESFTPFRVSLFVRVALLRYDLYLKLGAEKFVRIAKKGDVFGAEDAAKLLHKQIGYIHLHASDVGSFLRDLESAVHLIQGPAAGAPGPDVAELGLEIAHAARALAGELGWTDEVVSVASRGLDLAFRAVIQERSLVNVLKHRLEDPGSRYATHISGLVLVSAYLSNLLGWSADVVGAKLGLAALLHDLRVDEKDYEHEKVFNEQARNPAVRDPQVVIYREHPARAAEAVRALRTLPPDLDQIIAQHHYAPDGSGFPEQPSPVRIAPLSALFIAAGELEFLISEEGNAAAGVARFLTRNRDLYVQGTFRKIYAALAEAAAREFAA